MSIDKNCLIKAAIDIIDETRLDADKGKIAINTLKAVETYENSAVPNTTPIAIATSLERCTSEKLYEYIRNMIIYFVVGFIIIVFVLFLFSCFVSSCGHFYLISAVLLIVYILLCLVVYGRYKPSLVIKQCENQAISQTTEYEQIQKDRLDAAFCAFPPKAPT